jgi:hypothetical protein
MSLSELKKLSSELKMLTSMLQRIWVREELETLK